MDFSLWLKAGRPVDKVVCCDCLQGMKQLKDNSIDLVLTDPPYGHNNNNGDLISRREAALGVGDYVPERDNRPIANDGVEANELFDKFLVEAVRLLKNTGCCCCCCCCGGGPDPMFARWSLAMDKVLNFCQMIVWDKGPMGMGWRYRRSYETVLVAYKGDKMRWYDDSKKIENIIRHIPKIIPSSEEHPTVKPVDLMKHFIKLHTQEGDLVLDPFMGSGTTAVACQQLNRRFIGFELEQKYVDIAEHRLLQKPLYDFQDGQRRLGEV